MHQFAYTKIEAFTIDHERIDCMNELERVCVGYAFVPPQKLEQVFEPEEALLRGSLFPELYLPINVYGKCPCRENRGECCR